MPAHWKLPADHSAARAARALVGDELGDRPDVDDIALVASELTTNAVVHGLPPVELDLELVADQIKLTVSNGAGRGAPLPREAGSDVGSGRGLALVGMLADEWGWSDEGGRLRVWANFAS